jgi:hypothetical protein
VREAYVRSHTALDIFGLEFRDTSASFPVSKVQLARDLGPDIYIGLAMARKIMKANGQVMYRTSVRSLTPEEIASPVEKQARLYFDIKIEKKFRPSIAEADFKNDPDFADFATPEFEPYEDNKVPAAQMPDIDDVHDVDTYDQYGGAQVRVPIGNEIRTGKVMWHKRVLDGTVKGCANANAILDTRTYEIVFPDGRSDEYTANMIAENMYAQCDEDGNQLNIMECIVDHKNDRHSVDREDMYIHHGSNTQVSKTAKGYQGWFTLVR